VGLAQRTSPHVTTKLEVKKKKLEVKKIQAISVRATHVTNVPRKKKHS
jgi:hypothetical protein